MNTLPEDYENWYIGEEIMLIPNMAVDLLSEQFLAMNL